MAPISRRLRAGAVATALVGALASCTITFRERPLLPLDTDRTYAAPCQAAWEAVRAVVEELGPEIEEEREAGEGCAGLIVTDFVVLPDTGPDINHLRKVAHTGTAPFIGGRYALTVTVREVRDGTTKVKVVTRIEGYLGEEYGYQVLRSTGLIEEAIFARIAERLGVPAVTGP